MKRLLLTVTALTLAPALASAQVSIGIPGNLILPNYDRFAVGPREALEAGSYLARTNDAVACWYNPAGLASSAQTQVSASGNAYEAVILEVLGQRTKTGSFRVAPVGGFLGAVVANPLFTSNRYRAGFSITNPLGWEPGTIQFVPKLTGAGASVVNSALLQRTEVAASLGYRNRDALRFGGTLAFSFLSLNQYHDITFKLEAPNPGETLRRTAITDGTVYHLYARGGMQWDLTQHITMGLTLQSPGWQCGGSSRIWYAATRYDGDSFNDVLISDQEAKFEYPLPFNTAIGVSYQFGRGSVEVNARYYGAADEYNLFESDAIGHRTVVDSTGATTTTEVGIAPQVNSWRDVVNFSAGGNYRISERFSLHAGMASDSSPVEDPERSVFRRVDLLTFSGGVSFAISRMTGALGVAYSTGESKVLDAFADLGGNALITSAKVRSLRISYALSFAFGG